jgi:hypothetical protein
MSQSETSVDDLMRELNGGAGPAPAKSLPGKQSIENVDVTPEPKRPDPLETTANLSKPSPAAALDAKHSTAAGGKGYAVTVEGDYYLPSKDVPGKKTLRPYRIIVNLPELAGALSIIKNKLLDQLLRKKYGADGYLGFRTHEIVDTKPLGNSPESTHLQYMARPALESYVENQRIPLDPAIYSDVSSLRNAIMDWAQNVDRSSEVSIAKFVAREEARAKDIAEQRMLAEMNPELAPANP